MKMTADRLKGVLEENGCYPDLVSRKRAGTFRVVHGFFYRHGMDSQKWGEKVMLALSKPSTDFVGANLVDTSEHWHGFVGRARAGSSQDSYFEAVVRVD